MLESWITVGRRQFHCPSILRETLSEGKWITWGRAVSEQALCCPPRQDPATSSPSKAPAFHFPFFFPPPTSFFEMQIQIQNPSFSVNNSRTAPQQSANLPGWLLAAPIQVEPTMELQILSFSRSSRFSHHPTLSTGNLERIPALLPGQQQAMPMGSNSHCGLNSFLCAK